MTKNKYKSGPFTVDNCVDAEWFVSRIPPTERITEPQIYHQYVICKSDEGDEFIVAESFGSTPSEAKKIAETIVNDHNGCRMSST